MMAVPSRVFLAFLCALSVSCSKGQTEPVGCQESLLPDAEVCLELSTTGALEPYRSQIAGLVRETMKSATRLMPVDGLVIVVRDDPSQTIPEIGIGGYNPGPHRIILSIDPSFGSLEAALDRELPFQLAHELHHLKRRRSVGYGATLLEAMVSEGLADHFAMEVTGKPPPPWATALSGESLQKWLAEAAKVWGEKNYDHRAWFFGTRAVPRWAGYSIGFWLVQEYLKVHPGARAATLHDAKARRFKP